MDGVVTNHVTAIAGWASKKFGATTTPEDYNQGLTREQLNAIFTPEYFQTLPPYLNNIRALKQLMLDGHELHLVTHRPREVEDITIDWLEQFGLIPTTVTLHEDKALVASHLGLERFIEDYVPNANKLTEVVKHSYLINQPYNINEPVKSGVLRVDSVNEVRARLRLEQLGFDSPEEASGFIQTYTREEMIETVGN